MDPRYPHSKCDGKSSRPDHSGDLGSCISCRRPSQTLFPLHTQRDRPAGRNKKHSPFIETDIGLDKEEDLIWKKGRPQRSREVDMF